MTTGQSVYREPDGNVVLRSDNFALRFFKDWGGSPLQFWSEPFPLLTNPFPGSAASIYHEVGQDPTQATSDGITNNPIAIKSSVDSIFRYNYFGGESLFNPTLTPSYEVKLFCPDFWLSHEAADDWQPEPRNWITKYQHTPAQEFLFPPQDPTNIYFRGTPTSPIGFITPGNEMHRDSTFQDLRNYPEGRFAARFNVSFVYAQSHPAEAGITFRKSFPNDSSPTTLDNNSIYSAPGYHFVVTSDGKWVFKKVSTTISTSTSGKLSTKEKQLLKSATGLELQVRTHNGIPGYMECYVNSRLVYVTNDPTPHKGPFSFLYANSQDLIKFRQRRFYDVSIRSTVLYTATPDATIRATYSWDKAPGAENTPQAFYRAGLTLFLNQTTFPTNARTTRGIYRKVVGGDEDIDGKLIGMNDFQHYWIGNETGTIGLKATIVQALLNNQNSPDAHLLMQKHSFNDEFILGLNILPPQPTPPVPVPFTSGKLVIDWQTKL